MKVIKYTWLRKFYKGRMARLPTSSGMFAHTLHVLHLLYLIFQPWHDNARNSDKHSRA